MQVARVLGTVVSTQKEPSLHGVKFLLVELIDAAGQPLSKYEVAADGVGAGVDEWVLVSFGSAARQPSGSQTRPLDAVVIAIIDTISIDGKRLYTKE